MVSEMSCYYLASSRSLGDYQCWDFRCHWIIFASQNSLFWAGRILLVMGTQADSMLSYFTCLVLFFLAFLAHSPFVFSYFYYWHCLNSRIFLLRKLLSFGFEKPVNCGSDSSINNKSTLINCGSNYILLMLKNTFL